LEFAKELGNFPKAWRIYVGDGGVDDDDDDDDDDAAELILSWEWIMWKKSAPHIDDDAGVWHQDQEWDQGCTCSCCSHK
jgi:hypothetical protein